MILPTAVLSSSADCTFSATGIVPLCLSSYQTHSRLLMPGIPLEPNISYARFFHKYILYTFSFYSRHHSKSSKGRVHNVKKRRSSQRCRKADHQQTTAAT